MGGGKPGRVLAGRPLVAHVADALAAACDQVVVVAKADSELPALPGVERWDEPAEPRHPAAGIAYALERAGAPLLVCAADMPFVTAAACRALIEAAGPAVAVAEGRLQPLLAVYEPAAARSLRAAAEAGEPLTRAVERLAPLRVELPAALVRSVDTPEDLDSAR
ncbi:MAG: molybdenum cofactor guanylyltransferase [Thermoleophilaceae bacterium]|nr:molybdenum cofactor guanylyltransferase [Thermoleophilaceae bacterium]